MCFVVVNEGCPDTFCVLRSMSLLPAHLWVAVEEISVSWFVVTVSSICNGIKNGIMSMDDLKYFYVWERIQVRISVKSSFQFWRKLKGKGRRRWSRRGRMIWGVLIVSWAVTSVRIAVIHLVHNSVNGAAIRSPLSVWKLVSCGPCPDRCLTSQRSALIQTRLCQISFSLTWTNFLNQFTKWVDEYFVLLQRKMCHQSWDRE